MFVIEAQSGVNMFKSCVIGTGATEEAAWLDALGPKPWSGYTKKIKRTYTCRELDASEEPSSNYDD